MFSIIIPPNSDPPTRRSHKKSRGGCKVCKKRKLKCDEVKPVCGNCQRRFISIESCDYSQAAESSHSSSSRARPRPLIPRSGASQAQLSSDDYPSTSDTTAVSENEDAGDWTVSLPPGVRNEMLDPFKTHPECRVGGVNALLKFYLRTAIYTTFPWQPSSPTNPTTNFFLPLVFQDTVLFHATLQFSALRLERERARCLGINMSFLDAECIRLLRSRVENEEVGEGIKDQTIGAVATMAAVEHERGNMRMLKMHMDGLKRMVGLRGGLNAIRETNPMTANWVFWMSVVAICEVPFPPLDPDLPPFFPADHNLTIHPPTVISHFDDIGPLHSTPAPINLLSLGLSEPIASIMTSLQHVSQLVPTHNSYPTAATSQIILTRTCTLLSHLLSLPLITKDSVQTTSGVGKELSALVTEGARFASLLHILTPWRGLPPDGTIAINHILNQLMASLRSITASGTDVNNVLVLWMFAVGAVSSVGMPERNWFVSHLVEMSAEMGIGGWEEWRDNVSRCIWHERLYGRSYRKLWEEVAGKRSDLQPEGD